ncbi:MAG: MotA/TolQ/ExbB proton channel family protein [Actinomycetota bacterium]|nr:MotA/TolQ/ExbB proton channel family protein [Actinomycetota bacterium]
MTIVAAAIEDVVFDVVAALRVPVLVAALLALALVVVELGSLAVELVRRRRRDAARLERAAVTAREAVAARDRPAAALALRTTATSRRNENALDAIVSAIGQPRAENRIAKRLADFDLGSLRRLERTRMLVRAGPALGLMGTLIPLTPALEGLARGDTESLSDNLRTAFSITVLGLMIGAIAFGISLVRDRLYAQDLSDLEFVVTTLTDEEAAA